VWGEDHEEEGVKVGEKEREKEEGVTEIWCPCLSSVYICVGLVMDLLLLVPVGWSTAS
jgi:hypothetical protein